MNNTEACGPRPVTEEDFGDFCRNLITGTVEEVEALHAETGELRLPTPEALIRELWRFTRPGVTVEIIDLTDYKDQIADWDVVRPEWAWLHLFSDADGNFLTSYIDGASPKGQEMTDDFTLGINGIVHMLLVERGIPPEKAASYEPPSVKRLKEKRGNMGAALQAQIDQEVAAFREEMNSTLDSIFGEGGET